MREKLFKNIKIRFIFILPFLLTILYLSVFYYLDIKNNKILTKSTIKKKGQSYFEIKFKKPIKNKFWILKLRAGKISINVNKKVNSIEILTNKNNIIYTEKINPYKFQIRLNRDLNIRQINITPQNIFSNKVKVNILRKPILSTKLLFFQFCFLYLIFGTAFCTLFIIYHISLNHNQTIWLPLFNIILIKTIFLILLFAIFFLLNIKIYFSYFYNYFSTKFFINGVIFNVIFAIILITLFYLLSIRKKSLKLPFFLPVAISITFFFIKVPYILKACGDAILWVTLLKTKGLYISFAESLSILTNWFFNHLFNLFITIKSKFVIINTGKLFGIFFIFVLFYVINSIEEFSYKKKLLFFVLFLSLSVNAMFIGFPEFAYYPLPFLLLSFAFSKNYINEFKSNNVTNLTLATIFVILAGLFHGSGFFSFPVILLLPLLKAKDKVHISKNKRFYFKQYLTIFITVIITMTIYKLIMLFMNQYGFSLVFNTAVGGFDNRQFISFLPVNLNFPKDINLIEIEYFISRSWIFFISGVYAFLLFLPKIRKKLTLNKSDFILYLFGTSQLLSILFWGFDLGIRDFDLYIAPTTLFNLFLLKIFISSISTEIKKPNLWRYILYFSLLSPIYLFIILTTRMF